VSAKEAFIRKYGRAALEAAERFDPQNAKTLARIMLAQAALETGWGRHVPGNNLFGIKDPKGTPLQTKEFVDGKERTVTERFAAYNSPKESMEAYLALVSRAPRYRKAWESRTDPQKYFEELQKAGYATDPEYARKALAAYNSIPNDWEKLV